MYRLKNKNALIILAILFLFVAIPRIIFSDLDHGDEFTDADVLDAGKNFVKFGFIKCRFLPNFEPNLTVPNSPYTHFPPLPEIINGLLRSIFKTNSLYFFRSVSLLFSFLGILFWYLAIRKITNSNLIGFLSAIFYLANPLFIYGADSLHEPCYSEFLRSLIIFVFISMANIPKKKKLIFISLWLLIALESLITYEYVVYLSLFFILFKVFYRDSKWILTNKGIVILSLASVFGFLLHFLQNAWYFGSLSLAFLDLKKIAIERIANSQDAPSLNFALWWKYVMLRNFSMVFLFSYALLFLSAFFSYLLYQKLFPESKRRIKQLYSLFFILLICGISWYIIFPSHSWAHAFVNFLARHLLPVAAIGFTIFCYIILSFIKENLRFRLYANISLVLIIIIIVFTGIKNSELPITSQKIKMAQEFIKFKNCLLELKEISQEKDQIGINYFRYPFVRYYIHRHVKPIFDKSSLENLSNLPKYFIFIPYQNQSAHELFGFLNQRYVPLLECSSERFPTIFFELKK